MSKILAVLLAETARGRLVEFGLDQCGGGLALRVRDSVHVRETRLLASGLAGENADDVLADAITALADEHETDAAESNRQQTDFQSSAQSSDAEPVTAEAESVETEALDSEPPADEA